MDAFVYGTLTDPERVARVVSAFEFRGDAVLDGLHRVEGEYPTLAPGGSVRGRILRTPDVEALDAEAEWPGNGPFAGRVRAFVGEREVVVRPRGRE
ncbi:gamma-glutamylcyclotransferase [Halorussus salilacus]|uniref:gamma-glutamylcyclotransferase family protein n=1 Tax=Halorussus salilacus TaxID=2953750 RepID=UPI00209D3AF0|nr:gamma-glutamylcyclotransferase family protein [Halorussus salilacus]USZ66721.1 gamma-glutamylcyclotransferase [Halorussus salilacus]